MALKPRDAATLIIVRDNQEVLLGVRSAGHVFMPHMYVFPGGRVDSGDARVPAPVGLRADVESKILKSTSAARARAIAMTAVRETFEETGLILGHAVEAPPVTRSSHWQPFYQTGFVPALDKLDYVARAVTPPNNVRRYDARFFMVDAKWISGTLQGNGELEDLRWVAIDEAHKLELSPITSLILDLLEKRVRGELTVDEGIPYYRSRQGREKIEYE